MVDKDLLSMQEARSLIRGASSARQFLAAMPQERVDALCKSLSEAGVRKAEELAKLAVEETGFGIWQDKMAKNMLAADTLYQYIAPMKTIGVIREDKEKKMLEIATPAGIIAGLVPSTNPTSTTIYKAMIALKSGNAIIFSPHPSARNCIAKTVEMIQEVLEAHGAPTALVTMMSIPTIEGTAELMKGVDLILATGGTAMVKAAYSSGTPALGVGAGNVPAFIEKSADIPKAVSMIMESKTFDNGTVCASEQAIVTQHCISAQVLQELESQGGYFLNEEQAAAVKRIMERPNGSMNPDIVGRNAKYIADLAKITIPSDTRLLIYREKGVGPQYPFSKEKLTALMGYYEVEDWQQACELCFELLENGGIGHSLVIHSKDDEIVREFALKKPVSRLLVNTPSTHGAVGISTELPPSFTLGCGAVGGSSTSDNVSPMHLFNIRYVAYDSGKHSKVQCPTDSVTQVDDIEQEIRRITDLVLRQLAKT